MNITVFGGSQPKEGDTAYTEAQTLGRLLAERGHAVLTGGYIGTIAGAITIVLLQNVLQIVGIKPAGQQILYGLIILLMLFVYGRNARVRE